MKRLLGIDPLSGVREYFVSDDDKTFRFVTEQDARPIMRDNAREQTDGTDGWTPSKDMRKAATVPMVFMYKWLAECGGKNFSDPTFKEYLKRKLNDSEWRHFRTSEWRI